MTDEISRRELLTSRMILETLIPPPVLPALAPINIRITSISFESCGQLLKSVVAKPVVEIIEATENAAW